MTATHGRGHYFSAIWIWQRADASALQYLGEFDWVAVVPAHLAGKRPPFVPFGARLHPMSHGEEAWTWKEGT